MNPREKELKESAEGLYFEADVIRAWIKQLARRGNNIYRTMVAEGQCYGSERSQLNEATMVLENCLEQLEPIKDILAAIESRAQKPKDDSVGQKLIHVLNPASSSVTALCDKSLNPVYIATRTNAANCPDCLDKLLKDG